RPRTVSPRLVRVARRPRRHLWFRHRGLRARHRRSRHDGRRRPKSRQGLIVARKPGSRSMPKTPAVDHAVIRDLAKLLDETGLTEIEFQRDGVSIRVARNLTMSARGRAAELPIGGTTSVVTPVQATAPIDPTQHPGVVASPMVGTAYVGP